MPTPTAKQKMVDDESYFGSMGYSIRTKNVNGDFSVTVTHKIRGDSFSEDRSRVYETVLSLLRRRVEQFENRHGS